MTFEEWCSTQSEDLYKELEFLFYESAMTADDMFMKLEKTYEAGWNACADLNDSFTYDEVMSHSPTDGDAK